jgi:hypothetical protein
MSPDNLREAAKRGGLSAISSLVQKAFTTCEVYVDAEMQFGVTLWLKLKSDENLDSQVCLNVIATTLDSLKLEKITSVRISETSSQNSKQQVWNKYLALKQGKFVDNTKTVNQTAYAVCGVFALGLLFVTFTYKSPSTISSTTSTSFSSTESRSFLGRSQTGYELWSDRSCVYVKGITEADLARLNTDVWGFKEAVKAETGYKCVLFE